eukprot:UN28321
MSIINQFNSGVLDYLIATDESMNTTEQELESADVKVVKEQISSFLEDDDEDSSSTSDKESDAEEANDSPNKKRKRANSDETPPRKKQKTDSNPSMSTDGYGVSRGVDFREVSAVINFDFPETPTNYAHRVGRTARGGNYGLAISMINEKKCRRKVF